jgi:hypothetical protein
MNQEQYNTICKILNSGAPALAAELVDSLNKVITESQNMKKELDELKKEEKEAE